MNLERHGENLSRESNQPQVWRQYLSGMSKAEKQKKEITRDRQKGISTFVAWALIEVIDYRKVVRMSDF